MKVNKDVEPLVREAFGAALGKDPARMTKALQTMVDGGDQVVQDAITLTTVIGIVRLLDLGDGAALDDEELHAMATSIAELENWADINEPTVHGFLSALVGRSDRPALPAEVYTRLAFVVVASLLASFGDEDSLWYQDLDNILARIEEDERPRG